MTLVRGPTGPPDPLLLPESPDGWRWGPSEVWSWPARSLCLCLLGRSATHTKPVGRGAGEAKLVSWGDVCLAVHTCVHAIPQTPLGSFHGPRILSNLSCALGPSLQDWLICHLLVSWAHQLAWHPALPYCRPQDRSAETGPPAAQKLPEEGPGLSLLSRHLGLLPTKVCVPEISTGHCYRQAGPHTQWKNTSHDAR